MQGDDEAKPKEKDISDMSSSSAAYVESGGAGEWGYAMAPHVQEQIGRRLAAVYDEVLRQPIPERFLLLLDQLDESTKATKERSSAKETEIE